MEAMRKGTTLVRDAILVSRALTENEKTLHSKFFQCQSLDKNVTHYKARLAVCGSKKHDFKEDDFSPVTDLTVAIFLISFCKQRGWHIRHLDSDDEFTNGMLDSSVFVELATHTYEKKVRHSSVFKLQRSLYRDKGATKCLG